MQYTFEKDKFCGHFIQNFASVEPKEKERNNFFELTLCYFIINALKQNSQLIPGLNSVQVLPKLHKYQIYYCTMCLFENR